VANTRQAKFFPGQLEIKYSQGIFPMNVISQDIQNVFNASSYIYIKKILCNELPRQSWKGNLWFGKLTALIP